MGSYNIQPYQGSICEWDNFVEKANGGMLFHLQSFLKYHKDRFAGKEHHLGIYKGTSLHGVLPMAILEEGGRKVARSPYGASYGGPVFLKPLNYRDSMQIVAQYVHYCKEYDVQKITIVPSSFPSYTCYSETFLLALFEHGFQIANRDIISVVSLKKDCDSTMMFDERKENIARKARKAHRSEIVSRNNAPLDDFWKTVEKTFAKHQSHPTHSLDDMRYLMSNLPKRVYCDVAYYNNMPIAGIGFFVVNENVNHSFYLANDPEFQNTQALSLLVYEALLRCQSEGFHWFDFGTCSYHMNGRENIFRFKESFGAVGFFRDTYTLEL